MRCVIYNFAVLRRRVLAGAIGLVAVAAWCYPLAAQLPGLGGGVPNVRVPNVAPGVGPSTAPSVRAPRVRAPSVRTPDVRTPEIQPEIGGAARAAGDVTGAAAGTAQARGMTRAQPLTIASEFMGGQSGDLGMNLTSTTSGLRVANVDAGSLASGAGFRAGDSILAVNRTWVRSHHQLVSQLEAAAAASGQAWVFVDRAGQRQWISLDFAGQGRPMLGVNVADSRNGLMITSIEQASAAANAGLRAGDRVIAANGVAIRSAEDLTAQVEAAAQGTGVLALDIMRNGVRHSLEANIQQTARGAANVSQQVNVTARRLVNDLDGIAANAQGELRGRVAAAADAAAEIQADLRGTVAGGTEVAREKLAALEERLTNLKSDLGDLADRARGDVQARLDRTIEHVSQLQDHLASIAERTTARARGRVSDLRDRAGERIGDLRGDVREQARGVTGRVGELKESVIAKAGDVHATLRRVADNAADSAQRRADQLVGAAGDLHSRIDATVRQQTEAAADATARLQAEIDDLDADVSAFARAAGQAAQEDLAQVRADLSALSEDLDAFAQASANAAAEASAEAEGGVESATRRRPERNR